MTLKPYSECYWKHYTEDEYNYIIDHYENAFNLLETLAKEKFAPAQYLLGKFYFHSIDTILSEFKNIIGGKDLIYLYDIGEVILACTKSFKYFKKAAKQGNINAQFYLGRIYILGYKLRRYEYRLRRHEYDLGNLIKANIIMAAIWFIIGAINKTGNWIKEKIIKNIVKINYEYAQEPYRLAEYYYHNINFDEPRYNEIIKASFIEFRPYQFYKRKRTYSIENYKKLAKERFLQDIEKSVSWFKKVNRVASLYWYNEALKQRKIKLIIIFPFLSKKNNSELINKYKDMKEFI